jgi:tripartite-type tricarboxylate transporter receptor subunit TctC
MEGVKAMKRRTLSLLLIFFVLSIFNLPKELVAAPYYEGKVIKIVVGFPPGGGYDRMARILAKYIPKYIPGKPTAIVENMPGASGMIAANYIYNMAKPDGLTLGAINRVTPAAQLLKIEGVKFDMLKYSWIGSAAVETSAFVVRTDLPYKTYEDVKKVKEFNVGATGPGDTTYNFAILIKQFLGVNLKITTGYPGTPDIVLATERKEVDGYAGAYSSQRPHIARGLIRPILRTDIPSPGIEKLPSAEDLAADPMGKTIFKMYSVSDRVGRPYVASPGTPAEIMNTLRDAFAKMTKDPDLQQEADKMMMEVEYVPANDCIKEIQFFLNQPQDIVNEFKKYIKF